MQEHQRTDPNSKVHAQATPRSADFSRPALRSGIAHVRANGTDTARVQAKRHSHACAARGASSRSRQDLAHTPKRRRTRPCAAHKRGRMSTAGGAGGRHARGEEDGRERSRCGCKACLGDGLRGSARLQGVRRCVARAGLWHCQWLVSASVESGCWSPIVELEWILRTTARLNG